MKKLIINESQYNRLFGKRTKLVITESQYNKLLAEENMANSIKKISNGDVLQIVDGKGEKLHFRVIDAYAGQIIMINCNDGVFKNSYFFFTSADFSSSALKFKKEHKKRIDPNTSLIKQVKDWKASSFKNLQAIEVYEGDGNDCNLNPNAELKFTINAETGEPISKEEPKKEEPKKDVEGTDELIDEILGQKLDKDYIYHLEGDGKIYLRVIQKDGKTIGFNVLDVEGSDAQRYDYLEGDYIEFNGNKENIDLETEPDYKFDLTVKLYLGGIDNKEGGVKSEFIKISNIVDMELSSMKPKDDDDIEDAKFNYKELVDKMNDDEILKNLIQTTPSAGLELFGFVKKRGVIPSDEILRKWGISVKRGDVKLMGGKFRADKTVLVEYLKEINNETGKHARAIAELTEALRSVNNKDTLKVSRFYAGQKYITLKGKINGVKYSLRVKSAVEAGEEDKTNDIYDVEFVVTDNKNDKPIILGTTQIRVINYDF